MELYKTRASSSKCNWEGENSKGSVYSEIKKFMLESRKCQTLYANFEGSYNRRVFELKNKNTLENFVYSTMYFYESQSWDNEQNFSVREHVEKITHVMIKTSKSFKFKEEIHFGVAWVYYYSYEEKAQKAMPVFKIYKNKTGNEAAFLDTSLTVYNNWERYLDASISMIPLSFICLPRNGEYRMLDSDGWNTEGLDLEYVCSKKLALKSLFKRSRRKGFRGAKYMPFSQTAVRPWLIKISGVGQDVIRKLKVILTNLWGEIRKHKKQFINVVVFGLLFLIHMKEKNISFVDSMKMMTVDSLMLLNTASTEDSSLKNCLSRAFLSSITTSVSGFSNIDDAKQSLTKFQADGKLLCELFQGPKKNWYDILKIFCDLFYKCKPILEGISLVVPFPPILNSLFCLSNAFSHILQFFHMKSIESSNADKVQEMKALTLSSPNSELSLKPTGSFRSVDCVLETPTYLEDEQSERVNMTLENAFSNLPRLETIFSERSGERIFESFSVMNERHRQFSSQMQTHFVFAGKADGYGFFFIPNATSFRLEYIIRKLVEGQFIFEPEENVWKVTLKSGKTIGFLFFPTEYCAVALLSFGAIEEQSQTSLESESFTDMNYLE